MTQPEIEPWSPRPLANTMTKPMGLGFDKLINVTVNIFKIRNKLNHVDQDLSNSAKIYLLKVMQQQSFASEFAHLHTHTPQDKKVPELVKKIRIYSLIRGR